MTAGVRGSRSRRGGQRPGWMLLSALLALAIVASSLLVFTNRVELLKLAVIVALWSAVVAAFASLSYRRQSDADQARVRDLKYVYDLQLEREISARREYELTLESQLRHELSTELRVTHENEVAALRRELVALRAQLEILFDADLGHHMALESETSERTTVRAYSDWARTDRADGEPAGRGAGTGGGEDPIIDVSEVGVPTGGFPAAHQHHQPSPPARPQTRQQPRRQPHQWPDRHGRRQPADDSPPTPPYGEPVPTAESTRPQQPVEQPVHHQPPPAEFGPTVLTPPEPAPEPDSGPDPQPDSADPSGRHGVPPVRIPGGRHGRVGGDGGTAPRGGRRRARSGPEPEPQHAAGWRPAPSEGQWLPPGAPGSHWVAGPAPAPETPAETPAEHARHRRGAEPGTDRAETAGRHAETAGRHAGPPASPGGGHHRRADEQPAVARHAHRVAEPPPGPHAPEAGADAGEPATGRRAMRADAGTHTVDELMARLQATGGGGRRRRRRSE